MKSRIFLIGIILLALLLRLISLDSFPNGLHSQEATIGWRAQNLLTSGTDEFGRKLPLYFSNSSEIEMPFATYLTLPFVAVAPNNIFILRLPFALLGVLLVIGVILLTQKLFPNYKNLDLWTGLIIAISPATIWYSRFVNPQIIAFNLIIWGIYLIHIKRFQFIGAVLLGLSSYALPDAFIFTVMLTAFFIWKNKNFKTYLPTIILSLGFVLFMLFNKSLYNSWLESNFSLIKDGAVIDDINLIRGQNLAQGIPNILNTIFFNKAYYLILVIKNFLSYFNLSYIFAKGDSTIFNGLSNFGPLLISLLPIFLAGLYKLLKDKVPNKKLLFIWFISAAISGIFLAFTPNTQKFIFALFPLSVVTAIGFISLNKKIMYIFLIIVFFNLAVTSYDALNKESKRQQSVFHNDTSGLINFINEKTSGNVWITDQIDRDLGVKIGYLKQIPFKNADLKNESSNIYKQRVKTINNLYVGYKDRLKENPQNFDYIIKTKDEKYYGCFMQKGSFGEGDNIYLLMAKFECEDNGLEH